MNEPFKCTICGRDNWIGIERRGMLVGQCCVKDDEYELLVEAKKAQVKQLKAKERTG